jgi:hypothetical protein
MLIMRSPLKYAVWLGVIGLAGLAGLALMYRATRLLAPGFGEEGYRWVAAAARVMRLLSLATTVWIAIKWLGGGSCPVPPLECLRWRR